MYSTYYTQWIYLSTSKCYDDIDVTTSTIQVWSELTALLLLLKAILNWTEHSVREQLCLLEMFKLAVRFDVFDLG